MDTTTAQRLNELNARFYQEHASSFSATRQAPWEGWRRCLARALEALDEPHASDPAPADPAAGAMPPRNLQATGKIRASGGAAAGDAPRPSDESAPAGDARHFAWPPNARTPPAPDGRALRVLDLACGNLRFERFLMDALPDLAIRVDAVDSCATLADGATALPGVRFHELDVVSALLGSAGATASQARAEAGDRASAGNPTAVVAGAPLALPRLTPCDLAVSFGFLHHVPGFEQRAAVLAALVAQLRPGGVAAVSLWQFLDDERLARKAATSHPAALVDLGLDESALDEGDRLLGWQDALGAWRYCHHFAEFEVDALSAAACAATGARELARFSADGASGRLNRYLLLQVSA